MVNVFSYCLYGGYNDRYYPVLLENIRLAHIHFPEWKVYIWIAPDVEESFVGELKRFPNVVLRETGILGPKNMIERFCAIDEPGVDVMMVRDADSLLHWKDRWAIREFLQTDYVAHTIRDHEQHTARIMGGLWGLRKSAGIAVRKEYASYVEPVHLGHRVAHDQNFLIDVIYPKVVHQMLVHYSTGPVWPHEHSVSFPFEWTVDTFCGKTENVRPDTGEPPTVPKTFTFRRPHDGIELLTFLYTK